MGYASIIREVIIMALKIKKNSVKKRAEIIKKILEQEPKDYLEETSNTSSASSDYEKIEERKKQNDEEMLILKTEM